MKYVDIQKTLHALMVFSTQEIKMLDDKYEKSKISLWKRSGYIRQIIRGFYVSGNTKVDQNMLYMISNKIYSPSYISLEMAFSYYSIIPEQTFAITAVSTKKTINFDTEFGCFNYRKIKSTLFWGYKIVEHSGKKFLIADAEKSIIDYFYLNDTIDTLGDLEGLRWNKDSLRRCIDEKKLLQYTSMLGSKVVQRRVHLLFIYMQYD